MRNRGGYNEIGKTHFFKTKKNRRKNVRTYEKRILIP